MAEGRGSYYARMATLLGEPVLIPSAPNAELEKGTEDPAAKEGPPKKEVAASSSIGNRIGEKEEEEEEEEQQSAPVQLPLSMKQKKITSIGVSQTVQEDKPAPTAPASPKQGSVVEKATIAATATTVPMQPAKPIKDKPNTDTSVGIKKQNEPLQYERKILASMKLAVTNMSKTAPSSAGIGCDDLGTFLTDHTLKCALLLLFGPNDLHMIFNRHLAMLTFQRCTRPAFRVKFGKPGVGRGTILPFEDCEMRFLAQLCCISRGETTVRGLGGGSEAFHRFPAPDALLLRSYIPHLTRTLLRMVPEERVDKATLLQLVNIASITGDWWDALDGVSAAGGAGGAVASSHSKDRCAALGKYVWDWTVDLVLEMYGSSSNSSGTTGAGGASSVTK